MAEDVNKLHDLLSATQPRASSGIQTRDPFSPYIFASHLYNAAEP